ncbi:MAG TPA: VWA domain-containing protein [Vicinamibacterales bacterium]|jgi:VWFA-related protein|nr:VWA domain-containing protein [Vicinamibacterales bacterium]
MRAIDFQRALKVSAAAALLAAGGALQAQNAPPTPPKPATTQEPTADKPVIAPVQQGGVIRRSFDIVSTDVIVRDNKGQFIADLGKNDFEVYEDGVKQDLISFILTHGGRVYNSTPAPAAPVMEGIILPPSRPTNDAAGRIWLIFVDDLHLDFPNTGRIKDLFKKISNELVHEGDMFGIVSTGPSSLAIDLTYDRKRLTEAIDKISGAGLKPNEILEAPVGAEGPSEVRYRAHVAFDTAYNIMKTLESVHNRRKAFVYVSNGYDFDPFSETRKKEAEDKWKEMNPNAGNSDDGSGNNSDANDTNPFLQKGNQFSFADLANELSELTREANRANTTIYTIDPRGLVGMPDLDQKVDMMDFQNYIRTSQDSLRVLAEQTGGFATINQNDFMKALKRIDAETSDYYVLGYYSSNPDPTQRKRKVEIKVVNRPNVEMRYRTEYTLRPTKAPATKKK